MVMPNNLRLPITHIDKTTIMPRYRSNKVLLNGVYHVPSIKKDLLSMVQITSFGHFIVYGPQDVKVYEDLKIDED